jgi:glycosyltransferase involved in cell wall biosynthesis
MPEASPLVTIVMPTHDHGALIHSAIRSALAQSHGNFELLVVGDGVPDETRAIVAEYRQADPRVSFFDFPKGPRFGEIHRHEVLTRHARGSLVCYLADDDLWLPHHLAHMCELLREADFAQAFRVTLAGESEVFVGDGHFAVPWHRRDLLDGRNFVGLSAAGHTMELYRRAPRGWRTTPEGAPTDWYMWGQLLAVEPCRAVTGSRPSVIGLAQALRRGWSFERRQTELLRWEAFALAPGAEAELSRMAFEWLFRRRAELERAYAEHRRAIEDHEAACRSYEAMIRELRDGDAAAQAEIARLGAMRDGYEAMLRELRDGHAAELRALSDGYATARAEVERLGALHDEYETMLRQLRDGHATELRELRDGYAAAQAEIERLGAMRDGYEAMLRELRDGYADTQIEVERLRALRDEYEAMLQELRGGHAAELQELRDGYAAARAETERLGAMRDGYEAMLQELRDGYAAAQAEIERLRAKGPERS